MLFYGEVAMVDELDGKLDGFHEVLLFEIHSVVNVVLALILVWGINVVTWFQVLWCQYSCYARVFLEFKIPLSLVECITA